MKKLIYVPLEHIDQRYTIHLDNDIELYLNKNNVNYIKIKPPLIEKRDLKGMFLDASGTIKTKSKQINEIAELYDKGLIDNDTTFFFSDLWFPGIESLAYLNYFYKVKPKIKGIIHAGSFTDTDFVRDMERWAKNFEDIIFDICDTIFVASNFIKNDIIKKRIIDERKIKVTHLPLDSTLCKYKNNKKENIIIFNGRLCDEKQPWLFDKLFELFKDSGYNFIKTQEENLNKDEYYNLLAKSKGVVSFALQENFGFGIAEAVTLGCIPILPNKLVYPEFYDKEYLYNSFNNCCNLVDKLINNELKPTKVNFINPFKTWLK
jgi:glycosyltransferase involved in cell wall biosynthesis